MPCKNICFQFKATRSHAPNCQYYSEKGRYDNGQKRCQICEIFIKWPGSRCPCCHTSLRTRPRPKKYREKLLQKGVKVYVKISNHKTVNITYINAYIAIIVIWF